MINYENVMQPFKLKTFLTYAIVGGVNTVIHWTVFLVLFYKCGTGQALSNVLAFFVAVTFSFFANARWTFKISASTSRYVRYTTFMAAMAALLGWSAQIFHLPPLMTLCLFSGFSLICGYFYANTVVFRKRK